MLTSFGLVQQLQQLRAQMGGRDKLQIVLSRVAQRRHRHLERVDLALPDVAVEQGKGRDHTTLLDADRAEAEGELQQLSKQHGDRDDVL
mgnify:CR=1 FL=1